ncbi:MAG: hypothetical protein AAFV69_00490 [Pseudomonadota bacterium]
MGDAERSRRHLKRFMEIWREKLPERFYTQSYYIMFEAVIEKDMTVSSTREAFKDFLGEPTDYAIITAWEYAVDKKMVIDVSQWKPGEEGKEGAKPLLRVWRATDDLRRTLNDIHEIYDDECVAIYG